METILLQAEILFFLSKLSICRNVSGHKYFSTNVKVRSDNGLCYSYISIFGRHDNCTLCPTLSSAVNLSPPCTSSCLHRVCVSTKKTLNKLTLYQKILTPKDCEEEAFGKDCLKRCTKRRIFLIVIALAFL